MVAVLALSIVCITGVHSSGQAMTATPFAFRSGQSMYIVAFCRGREATLADSSLGTITPVDYTSLELGAETKVREKIEEWKYFKVADKASEADFIFLVRIDDNAMEGLAVPITAYREHFKANFDLDALRESANGRYLAGPLKIPTLGRLTDRLVKDFRSKVGQGR